ncbi:MAG: DUF1501 domain-containing protein [Verrucomicrobiales bacterium]
MISGHAQDLRPELPDLSILRWPEPSQLSPNRWAWWHRRRLGAFLPQLLALESRAGIRKSHKSVILIYLVGGPPHQDMFDLKPDAPSEISGPFRPIGTNVPGIEICELFPLMAKRMNKFAVIRSLVGAQGGHDAFQCYTGRKPQDARAIEWIRSFGSVVSAIQGPVHEQAPPLCESLL